MQLDSSTGTEKYRFIVPLELRSLKLVETKTYCDPIGD